MRRSKGTQASRSKPGSKNGEWEKFFGFLGENRLATRTELREELASCGVNLMKLDAGVDAVLETYRKKDQLGWLTRARKAQDDFEARLKAKSATWLSSQFKDSKSLYKAISTGQLGMPMQQHAQVFFRNKDISKASDGDLRSFLDDCELLGLVQKDSAPETNNVAPIGTKSKKGK